MEKYEWIICHKLILETPPEYDLTKPHIYLVKNIKQMQPGEENAPSIDCSGNYEAAGAELGQGGKIHGAFSWFLSSI